MNRVIGGIIVLASFSCKKSDDDNKDDITRPQLIEANSNSDGIMRVDVEIQDTTVKLRIQDQPKDGQLICEFNGSQLEKCEDGMEIPKPVDGEHRFKVKVMKQNEMISIGETRFETGSRETTQQENEPASDSNHPLYLEIANADFVNGGAVNIEKEFLLKFRFKNSPACKPSIRCTIDKSDGQFSPLCNLSDGFRFEADLIARGLQYLKAQASCDGKTGPELIAYWYGVPSGYEPLKLESLSVGLDNKIFRLVKINDCPEDLLKFECSEATSTSFTSCAPTRRTPKAGFRIRANCNNQIGPVLVVN
jgi:hypothetical protein